MPRALTYRLTADILAAHLGAGVMCFAREGEGRVYAGFAARPGPELNLRAHRLADGTTEWRSDLPSGSAHVIAPVAEEPPALIRVDMSGPLEQRAGFYQHGDCGGSWVDGHDALADRLCEAFREGDVLFVGDTPGGAAAAIGAAVERVLKVKAAYGRRCTGFADEQVASAGIWWMLAICDEVFGVAASQWGSVGARGEHMDISGMMALEGLKKTYFADPPEKVALAPEFPLSAVGAARGNRDVTIAATAFRAAVCASPIGQRFGLTPESLIELGADMLTGENAVGVFADGIESFDDVVAYALTLAESDSETRTSATAKAATHGATARATTGDRAMSLRAEGAEPDEKTKADGDEEKGIDIPTKCKSCRVENDKDAHFCKGCGESMATEAVESDEPPPSSKPKPDEKTMANRAKAPIKMDASASLASILGASAESPLALKTAAIGLRQIRDTAVGVFGQTEPGAIVGAMLTVPERLEKADIAAAAARTSAANAERTTRRDLANRLNALSLDAWPRTAIFADEIRDGAPVSPPPLTKTIARWDLSEFRGYVEGFEKKAKPRTPFEASRDAAAAGAGAHAERETVGASSVPQLGADGEPSAAQIERAKKDPTVLRLFAGVQASNPAATIDMIAKQHVKTCAAMGVAIGGAS